MQLLPFLIKRVMWSYVTPNTCVLIQSHKAQYTTVSRTKISQRLLLHSGSKPTPGPSCLKIGAELSRTGPSCIKPSSPSTGCRMFRPIPGSAHGPNHPTARPVNCEVFSLAWAEPSMYVTSSSGLRGPKRLTNCNLAN